MKFILFFIFIAFALVAFYPSVVESDDYEHGKLTLWSKVGFRGSSITLTDTIYDLSKLGYRYKVKSIDVEDGAFILYAKRYFRGPRIFVYQYGGVLKEGRYPDPYTWDSPYYGFKVGSLRKVDGYHKEFDLSHEEQLQFMGNITGSPVDSDEIESSSAAQASIPPVPTIQIPSSLTANTPKVTNCTVKK